MSQAPRSIPSVSVKYSGDVHSTQPNELGIYRSRRFKNNTERLEKVFGLHTRMTVAKRLYRPQF